MLHKNKVFKSLALVLVLSGLSNQPAIARELRMASGVPPLHPATNPLYTEFQKRIGPASGGSLSARLLGTEVVRLGKMRDGIKSKLVEVGLFLPAYFPADLPNINLAGDMAFLSDNPHAAAAAMTEYVVTCAECQAELKKLGIAYTTSHSTNTYHILSNKPVRDVADLQGMRIRVGGPQYSRWAEAMGATPAKVPVGETFQSLSQGTLDGTVAAGSDIVAFKLDDVIKHITTVNLGTYFSVISHAVEKNVWKSLSVEDRKAIARTSTITNALCTEQNLKLSALGMKKANAKNIEIIKPSSTLVEATAKFVEDDLKVAVKLAEKNANVKNGDAKLARFRALMAKWNKIAEANANDPQKMADAVQSEVWDHVDFTTYGL
jgi:TRAP-type transport system periplasmic protein